MKKNLVPHKNPEVIQAITEADTLMAVREWLEKHKCVTEHKGLGLYSLHDEDIAALKAGKWPEGMK